MQPFDYEALKDRLVPIIMRFGTNVTLTRKVDSELWRREYNPREMLFYWVNIITGDRVEDSLFDGETNHLGLGVITQYQDEDIDGSLITQSDRRVLILAKNFPKPREGEVMEIGGINYTTVRTRSIKPAGTDVVYIVQARI